MASLSDKNIFCLKPLIKNFPIKLSAYSVDPSGIHTLCLVGKDNTIILRTSKTHEISKKCIPKTILWFKENQKCIQDVCFDQKSGSMLLILCKYIYLSAIISTSTYTYTHHTLL